jgi:hypothetical protein
MRQSANFHLFGEPSVSALTLPCSKLGDEMLRKIRLDWLLITIALALSVLVPPTISTNRLVIRGQSHNSMMGTSTKQGQPSCVP